MHINWVHDNKGQIAILSVLTVSLGLFFLFKAVSSERLKDVRYNRNSQLTDATDTLLSLALHITERLVHSNQLVYDSKTHGWALKQANPAISLTGSTLQMQFCDPRYFDPTQTVFSGLYGRGCNPESLRPVLIALTPGDGKVELSLRTQLPAKANWSEIKTRTLRARVKVGQ